jgi:predicted GIY-YIG superfamily endonuclease
MSRWVTLDGPEAYRFSNYPRGGGVYAVYYNGQLVYIGMSADLKARMQTHGWVAKPPFASAAGMVRHITVKYSPDRLYAEHATREKWLLRRLRPPLNKIHKGTKEAA